MLTMIVQAALVGVVLALYGHMAAEAYRRRHPK